MQGGGGCAASGWRSALLRPAAPLRYAPVLVRATLRWLPFPARPPCQDSPFRRGPRRCCSYGARLRALVPRSLRHAVPPPVFSGSAAVALRLRRGWPCARPAALRWCRRPAVRGRPVPGAKFGSRCRVQAGELWTCATRSPDDVGSPGRYPLRNSTANIRTRGNLSFAWLSQPVRVQSFAPSRCNEKSSIHTATRAPGHGQISHRTAPSHPDTAIEPDDRRTSRTIRQFPPA